MFTGLYKIHQDTGNRIASVTVFFSVLNKPWARFAQSFHIDPTIACDNRKEFQISDFPARVENTFFNKTFHKVIDGFARDPKITGDIGC